MRKLANKPNVVAPAGAYPFGRIKDRALPVHGTPVTEQVYGDIHVFFEKLMSLAALTANDLPENDTNGYQLNNALQTLINSAISTEVTNRNSAIALAVPSGTIVMWSGTTAPSGWGLCDGAGGRPNLKGKFIVGYDSGDADYSTIGNNGGGKTATLSVANLPAHHHNMNPSLQITTVGLQSGSSYPNVNLGTAANRDTDDAGSGTGHENRPPYYTLAYIVKL